MVPAASFACVHHWKKKEDNLIIFWILVTEKGIKKLFEKSASLNLIERANSSFMINLFLSTHNSDAFYLTIALWKLTIVTHAALLSLCLAIRNAFSILALSFLQTHCLVLHWRTFRAFGRGSGAPGFLFAGCVLSFPALDSGHHELTMLTTRRVLITADSSLVTSQLAIFVAAGVVVLSAQ